MISRRGKEAVVGILENGNFFGEAVLTGQQVRTSIATAMGNCLIVRLAAAEMTRVLAEEPTFPGFFIAHLLSRNLRIEEDLVDQLFNSSEKRLARMLLLLSNYGKEGKPIPVIPDVTQEMLADMIGTTRSRVSFFMNKFRKTGLHLVQRDLGGALVPAQRRALRLGLGRIQMLRRHLGRAAAPAQHLGEIGGIALGRGEAGSG